MLATTSENQENQKLKDHIQELESKLDALTLRSPQGIFQFIALIYVLYCYLYAVTFLIHLLSYQEHHQAQQLQPLVHQQKFQVNILIIHGWNT